MLRKKILCTILLLALCLSGCSAYNNSGAKNMTDDGYVAESTAVNSIASNSFAANDTSKGSTSANDKSKNITNGSNQTAYDEEAQDVYLFDDTTAGAATNTAGAYKTTTTTAGMDFSTNINYNIAPDNNTRSSNENVISKEMPEAGQLTAGTWSDNDNWGFFSNLISSDKLSYPLFGLNPTKRILVNLKTKDGQAVKNASVTLVNEKDDVIWKGVTDYMGRVYLINQNDDEMVFVKVESTDVKEPISISKEAGSIKHSQSNSSVYSLEKNIVLDNAGKTYNKADIMFIIDSTGSMYDELDFLQSEFTEITKRIGNENTRYSVNFYRDEGDEYLTKCNKFSSDVTEVQKIINKEEANGGKGQIAAVAQALDQTMNANDWSEDSVKLAFLIFDAPPYKEAADSLAKSVETAAAKGIRLIPVVGSGSDLDVELFGRAVAIETGGVYVFLTDDSGIGESHEEPIIGEHEVRPLVDIVTDIIKEYRQ